MSTVPPNVHRVFKYFISLIRDYGSDLVFLILFAWLTPWLHARIKLPDVFPHAGTIFYSVATILAGVEVIILYFFVRMTMYRHYRPDCQIPFSGAISLLRIFAIIPVAMPLFDLAAPLALLVLCLWILGHLVLAGVLMNGSIKQDLPAPDWLYTGIQVVLFASMFCFTTSGYIKLHDMGAFDLGLATRHPGEFAAYLALAAMIYVPARLFDFIKESMLERSGRHILAYSIKLTIVLMLLVAEMGTLDPRILDTALDHGKNLQLVTKLDLSNSDLKNLHQISQFTHLDTLILRSNQLKEIPEEILALENLRHLHLTHNLISQIPQSISRMKNLRTLTLSVNQLSEFPKEVLDLPNLNTLSLSHNQIVSIPAEIKRLRYLDELGLEDNLLRSLPIELLDLPLRKVNVTTNNLSDLDMRFREKFARRDGWYW